jgi:hypothetical protein
MKRLLAYANEMDIWHKLWGNAAFTIEISDERSAQGVKTKFIQMVQTHGLVQLSMGAALIDSMIDIDTPFTLRLLPGADGKPWPPTTTLVREVFSLMEINRKKGVDMLIDRIKQNVHRLLFEHSRGHKGARGCFYPVSRGAGILVALQKRMCHGECQLTDQALLHIVATAKGH